MVHIRSLLLLTSAIYYFCNCAEQKHEEKECATQQGELLLQQLKQANETIAALTERLSRIQLETSQLFNVLVFL